MLCRSLVFKGVVFIRSMSLNVSIRPFLVRNGLQSDMPRDFHCFRRIRLLRRRYLPRRKHIMEDQQLFGKLLVPAKIKNKVNIDVKPQPNTEFLYIKRATLNPWRKLVRKNGNWQPEVPLRLMRPPSPIINVNRKISCNNQYICPRSLNLPAVSLSIMHVDPLQMTKQEEEYEDRNWGNEKLAASTRCIASCRVSKNRKDNKNGLQLDIPLSAYEELYIPHSKMYIPPPQIQKCIELAPIFYENMMKRKMRRISDSKLCRTVMDNKDFQNAPSIREVLSRSKSKLPCNAYPRILEKSQVIRSWACESIMNEFQVNGIDMYLYVKRVFCGEDSKASRKNIIMKSLKNQFKHTKDVQAIQMYVVHPTLHYKGYVDSVASYKGMLSVIQWKKSDKKTRTSLSISDVPVSLAACIGAINRSKHYPFIIRKGTIIIAHPTGKTDFVLELNEHKLENYWCIWQQRFQQYYTMIHKSLLR